MMAVIPKPEQDEIIKHYDSEKSNTQVSVLMQRPVCTVQDDRKKHFIHTNKKPIK
jgi:hypothetical protein